MTALTHNESYPEYRTRVLDAISPTFCGAKWYNATVWLGNGMTASCHHPPAHKIPLEEIAHNPSALHNTKVKKAVRQEMLDGVKPSECEYCWKVESLGPLMVSDRTYKSVIYSESDLKEASAMGADADVALKTLEIAFDSNCNFACSYCNASFSTTWQSDLKVAGPYTNLQSDGRFAYADGGAWLAPYGKDNANNPYVEAFWKWWTTELQYSLRELRVTGGEATMSNDFWKLIQWFDDNPDCTVGFAVNTNLGVAPRLIDRLIATSKKFKKISIYTSNESFGAHAEYIRDGLKWDQWTKNVEYILEDGDFAETHCMMTINALCLLSLKDLLDWIVQLRTRYEGAMRMSFNILRFPSFQAIPVLPKEIREAKANELEQWLETTGQSLKEFEREGLRRTIAYAREIEDGHTGVSDIAMRTRDFKAFFKQYDQRRGKDLVSVFPELEQWYNEIPATIILKQV